MKRVRLFIDDGAEAVERTFTRFPVRIGRHPTNEYQILDDQVSRFHAQLEYEGDSLVIRDLSRNGTTLVGGDGGGVRTLRAEEARSSEGSLTFVLGTVRIQAELEAVGPDELPGTFASAARAATKTLVEACGSRGLPLWAGDPSPERLRAVIDALFGNLLRFRTALHGDALEAEGEGAHPGPQGEGAIALLEWTHATAHALRAIELAFERTWPRANPLAQEAARLPFAESRRSGVHLRSTAQEAPQIATGSDRGKPPPSSRERS